MPESRGRRAKPQPNAKTPPNKGSEPKPSTLPTSQHQTPAPASSVYTFRRILGRIVGKTRSAVPSVLTWAAVVVTLVSGVIVFFPRVTVDPSGPYDPVNPSPITFTVANTNIVPLRDVKLGMGICYIVGTPTSPSPHCNGPVASVMFHPQWYLRWLDSDEKHQIAIEDMLKRTDSPKQFEDADITIVIEYTPWLLPSWPFREHRQFRFITMTRSDRKIYWIPVPLNR